MIDLREETKNIFNETIKFCDTADATKRSVKLEGNQLEIEGRTYDLKNYSSIYSVALGKAAFEMAQALDEILGSSLSAGVVSGNRSSKSLSSRWTKFYGGHPLPNEDSIESAKAAFKLLDKADEKSLVIFLVSGGGSAMIELPAEDYITLDEIRKTNELLVSCGAHISEVNSIRKTLSAIKGGGLSFRAKESTQISLLVSDTRKGEEAVIASGPTIVSTEGISPVSILKKYKLDKELPSNVIKAVLNSRRSNFKSPADHKIVLLMDNESALSFAAAKARESGLGYC
jgi:glycerate 2-kinase